MSYPFEETKYLCVSSGLIGVSALYMYIYDSTLSFLLATLCLTSINHWRKYVENGIRQRLDIACVFLCGLYIAWKTLCNKNEFKLYLFFSILVCLSIFFFISMRGGCHWVVFHASLHLYLSFFVPLLYIL